MVMAAKKAKNNEVKEMISLSTNKIAVVSPIKDSNQYGIADLTKERIGLGSCGCNTIACSLSDGKLCHKTK